MVVCAMAVPANKTPTSGDAIAHRSVLIVRDLSINREVEVSTERVRVTFWSSGQSTHGLHPWRVKLISVTTATNRDYEKRGLTRKSRKSAPNRTKSDENGKLCRLWKMSGQFFWPAARRLIRSRISSRSLDKFVQVLKQRPGVREIH